MKIEELPIPQMDSSENCVKIRVAEHITETGSLSVYARYDDGMVIASCENQMAAMGEDVSTVTVRYFLNHNYAKSYIENWISCRENRPVRFMHEKGQPLFRMPSNQPKM